MIQNIKDWIENNLKKQDKKEVKELDHTLAQKKILLESVIGNMLQEFSETTGVPVLGITFDYDLIKNDDKVLQRIKEVNLNLKLDESKIENI